MALTVIEAARSLWPPGLAQVTKHPQMTIQDWIGNANYAPTTLNNTLILTGVNQSIFLEALGSDINRLASAGSETLKNIATIDVIPKSMAWPYVKLYYSALFYAHSMLRIWGRSPSYIRTSELMPLRNVLTAYGVSAPYSLQTGQYLFTADMRAASVSLQSVSGSGGAHEFLWREFHRALTDLKINISAGGYLADDKKRVTKQLNALIALISKNGQNLSWPSQMRNDIQYRQAEGLWYPYRGKAKTANFQQDVAALTLGKLELDKILTASGDDLAHFRSACMAVISLARGVIEDMSSLGGPKSFLQYGQRKFENATAVKI